MYSVSVALSGDCNNYNAEISFCPDSVIEMFTLDQSAVAPGTDRQNTKP
ncbi:MAG TPA: hypothetical protein VHO70_13070 [Chitinispirillaceae bacterium]|nr:hypothetical protein [Chitinispirillaceae bacterium]